MFRIRSQQDLRHVSSILPSPYFRVVEDWFNELRAASPCEEFGAQFVLDSGCIYVSEPLGKPDPSVYSLVGSPWVEYVESIDTSQEGLRIWKIVCMHDNDDIETWFVPEGMSQTLDDWASSRLEA